MYTSKYYGRQYPHPPTDEVCYIIRRSDDEFKSHVSRIETLLDDDAVPSYVADSVRRALDEVSTAYQAAISIAYTSMNAVEISD